MKKTLGIRHIALKVCNMEDSIIFYKDILGMEVDWQPDPDNVYLTNGLDNLALHKQNNLDLDSEHNRLDHFGIMLKDKADVDSWYNHIKSNNVIVVKELKDHRDGSRSFYCSDPDNNVVQIIWHPILNK